MEIARIGNNNQMNFTSIREGKMFRRMVNKLIVQSNKMAINDPEYVDLVDPIIKPLRLRLQYVLFTLAEKIGSDYVTPEDRRLHAQLKGILAAREKAAGIKLKHIDWNFTI